MEHLRIIVLQTRGSPHHSPPCPRTIMSHRRLPVLATPARGTATCPPVPTSCATLSRCPPRALAPSASARFAPLSQPPIRQGFPEPPISPSTSAQLLRQLHVRPPDLPANSYHYMMPNVPPPPLPHPPVPPSMPQPMSYQPPYSMGYAQPPFPPPGFGPGYAPGSGSAPFKADHFRHGGGQYKAEKPPGDHRRSRTGPGGARTRHAGRYGYPGHGDRHKMDYPPERKDRGRSPDRRRAEGAVTGPPLGTGAGTAAGRDIDTETAGDLPPQTDSTGSGPGVARAAGTGSARAGRRRGERGGPMARGRAGSGATPPPRAERRRARRPTARRRERGEEEEFLKPAWIRCTHAENYYSNDPMDQVGDSTVVGTSKLRDLYERFEEELGRRQERAKSARPEWEPPKTKLDEDLDESSSDSECESDGGSSCSSSSDSEVFDVIAEIKRKKAHPDRLHEELWYNDPGQMNDGPLCKCSAKARRTGIRHSIYPGEELVKVCRPMNNNAGKLFHYRITVSPPTNFLTDRPTVIEYDDHEYLFEGFSLFSHTPSRTFPCAE
ncbi:hypothetical protein ANANG_G00076690 [Anguilla anguilla]|uniref:Uncharacterized protein n=1 Tax=Anguilla anguilla TaxID=7936 RepID=A0A9D3MMA8_ANGAN|nr:hypothetical protein ANANG_G00076690 [Anguilla anguilla]